MIVNSLKLAAGGNIHTTDIGNPLNQELQTTNCSWLLKIFQHTPGYGYHSLSSLWMLFQALDMHTDQYLAWNLRGISADLLMFRGPQLLWPPQTTQFIFLIQGDC